ncbi:MAG: TlyA family RNA methyltransferase [Armatimonadota bacterium]|nr:TlyA family RNA methyltransferase [Armatimonadota bacterium]MDR7403161.1 TlyA family RNA methyltransferase [Armatimonadota bacterium]
MRGERSVAVREARAVRRRVRLDSLLVERGLAESRAKAAAAIVAGEVLVGGAVASKPGQLVDADADVQVRPRRPRFVSRGGEKLLAALEAFGLDVAGRVAVDVGASTGGFTDCLLQRGAARVYAVDVGTGQLHWRLRRDPRVVSLERRDVRSLTPADVGGPVDLATVDVSFISLRTVLPAVASLVRPGGDIVALIKPQFEVGPRRTRRGVVRDPALHADAIRRVLEAARAAGLAPLGLAPSPLRGPEGNLEFFVHLRRGEAPPADLDVEAVVARAHAEARPA